VRGSYCFPFSFVRVRSPCGLGLARGKSHAPEVGIAAVVSFSQLVEGVSTTLFGFGVLLYGEYLRRFWFLSRFWFLAFHQSSEKDEL